jgi:hypothetical protein
MVRLLFTTLWSFMLVAACVAQDLPVKKAPTVTMAPPPLTSIIRGRYATVELQFRVEGGFHINSNQPGEKYLLPTTLKIAPPTDLVVGKITYPPGKSSSFAFAPDQLLSVYSGDFAVTVQVRSLASVMPGNYELRGNLRYQACDNAQCYPPKTLPVQFEVKVVKAPTAPKKKPGQSPHE